MYFAHAEKHDDYVVDIHDDWSRVESAWEAAMACRPRTPMQSPGWFSNWYATIGRRREVRPLLVEIFDRESGELALGLPLAAVTRDALVSIEFADDDLTDYNLPVLGPAAPVCATRAARAFRALTAALPPADLLRLTKMPRLHGDACNPFTLLPSAGLSSLAGNRIVTGDSYDDWRNGLLRKHRREAGRILRVFESLGDAKFVCAEDRAGAHAILDMIEEEQRRRIHLAGKPYRLDEDAHAAFYRSLVDRDDPSCSAVVTALTLDGKVIAGLFGVTCGTTCIILRLAFSDGFWTRASPGRLVLERTMHALHEQGCRCFDLGIGEYDYKRQFQPEKVDLFEIVRPLSLRGLPESSLAWARSQARRNPAVERLAKRIRSYARG